MTSSLLLPRRTFISGALSLLAAPSIVRATSIMPVREWKPKILADGNYMFANGKWLSYFNGSNGKVEFVPDHPKLKPAVEGQTVVIKNGVTIRWNLFEENWWRAS